VNRSGFTDSGLGERTPASLMGKETTGFLLPRKNQPAQQLLICLSDKRLSCPAARWTAPVRTGFRRDACLPCRHRQAKIDTPEAYAPQGEFRSRLTCLPRKKGDGARRRQASAATGANVGDHTRPACSVRRRAGRRRCARGFRRDACLPCRHRQAEIDTPEAYAPRLRIGSPVMAALRTLPWAMIFCPVAVGIGVVMWRRKFNRCFPWAVRVGGGGWRR